jgi:protocatechuate 3,4-dioxygenase beta subunit
MPSRRDLLAGLTASFAGSLAARAGSASDTPTTSCVLTPDSGEGPYYFDPKLVRSDITERRAGVPLALDVRVVTAGVCTALPKVRVDVWHADARGIYSGYAGQYGNGGSPERSAPGATYLRGTQFADDDGRVAFRTIYPSWYRGRTPHIHFKVFVSDREVVASQLYFPDKVSDRVYSTSSAYAPRSRGIGTYNEDDMFLRGGRVGGAFCDVIESGNGYRGSVVIGIAKT